MFFAICSFDTVFRVNASLFSVTSFKGVSIFCDYYCIGSPYLEVANQKNVPASGAVVAEL